MIGSRYFELPFKFVKHLFAIKQFTAIGLFDADEDLLAEGLELLAVTLFEKPERVFDHVNRRRVFPRFNLMRDEPFEFLG
jgi:hypothetical protein